MSEVLSCSQQVPIQPHLRGAQVNFSLGEANSQSFFGAGVGGCLRYRGYRKMRAVKMMSNWGGAKNTIWGNCPHGLRAWKSVRWRSGD